MSCYFVNSSKLRKNIITVFFDKVIMFVEMIHANTYFYLKRI